MGWEATRSASNLDLQFQMAPYLQKIFSLEAPWYSVILKLQNNKLLSSREDNYEQIESQPKNILVTVVMLVYATDLPRITCHSVTQDKHT